MHTTIVDEYLVSEPALFWREVFFSQPVQEQLYRELGCLSARVERQTGSLDQGIDREFVFEQPMNAPGPLKKVFGDRQTIVERGTFDAARGEYHFQVIPEGALAKKVKMGGTVRVEPKGQGKIARIIELSCSVDLFGVGGLAEKYLTRSTTEIYAKRTVLEHEVVQKKGLSIPPPPPAP
jgi:hypothetical protein